MSIRTTLAIASTLLMLALSGCSGKDEEGDDTGSAALAPAETALVVPA